MPRGPKSRLGWIRPLRPGWKPSSAGKTPGPTHWYAGSVCRPALRLPWPFFSMNSTAPGLRPARPGSHSHGTDHAPVVAGIRFQHRRKRWNWTSSEEFDQAAASAIAPAAPASLMRTLFRAAGGKEPRLRQVALMQRVGRRARCRGGQALHLHVSRCFVARPNWRAGAKCVAVPGGRIYRAAYGRRGLLPVHYRQAGNRVDRTSSPASPSYPGAPRVDQTNGVGDCAQLANGA